MEDLHDLNPDAAPSKTRKKQAMEELQTLGEQLAELPADRLIHIQVLDADGYVAVPTAPGIGVEIDEDVLAWLRVDG